MAWKPASTPGDVDELISDARKVLGRQSYGKAAKDEGGDTYTEIFGTALVEYAHRVNAQVDTGARPLPRVTTTGVFDWTVKKQMQLGQYAPPPPIKRRFPAFVFRGTGGIVGLDLVSQVCQANADLVEEINTPWSATMGGLPVGTAGNVNDPSMWRGAQEALPLAQAEFLRRKAIWPEMKAVVGGYSAGDVVAALFEQWVKESHPDNFLCGFRFGSPTRPTGGGFFGQAPPWGNGIADMEIGDVRDFRTIWCTNNKDMYAQIPGGVAGDIMDDVYAEVSRFEFSNLLGAAQAMVTTLPGVLAKAGIPLPSMLGALAGGLPGLFAFGLPVLIGMLPQLIGTTNPADYDRLTGSAAAGVAAKIGLEFLFAGTGPHIRYHIDPAWAGGPTFLDLARMHVRDYCSRPGTIELLH